LTRAAGPALARLRTGGIGPGKPRTFDFSADALQRTALASDLGLLELRVLRLLGEVNATGRDEILLTATLKADADQPCVVTLAPVRTRIDEPVRRRYVAGLAEPEGDEIEMPEDDGLEPMPDEIDLAALATEALALALPLYPRAPGAELGEMVHAPAGAAPLTDAALKPFAGLASLAERLGPATRRDDEDTG
jgi:uncharacterized metal-binding protein YceD (DUF177 family)